jgi:hypothetical protein
MTHIMVDLETWGTTPGCHLRSIGAIVFNPETGEMGNSFYQNITEDSGQHYGLTQDADTIEWWSKQSQNAQSALDVDAVPIDEALARFTTWWRLNDAEAANPARFWAHGPSFDEAVLAAAYRAIGGKAPWHFRAARDTRTIFEAAGGVRVRNNGTLHHALDDAKAQADAVAAAFKLLRGPAEHLAAAGNFLAEQCHKASADAGWWTDLATGESLRGKRNIPEMLCLIHSEISEAMEGHRKNLHDDKLPHRMMMEVELADAVIRIFDLAGSQGYDIGGAIAEKMAFNRTRADHSLTARRAAGGKAF